MRGTLLVSCLVALLLLASCGGDADPQVDDLDTALESTPEAPDPDADDGADETPMTDEDEAAGGATVATTSSPLGEILVDGDGRTLYVFDNDSDGESSCYDQCEENWPPFTGDVSAGEGVDDGLIGTTTRTDGSAQVTYAGSPLYYYAADQAAGDTSGQGVGGVWWVVGPDGQKVTTTASVRY